jgi:Transposase DDE domain
LHVWHETCKSNSRTGTLLDQFNLISSLIATPTPTNFRRGRRDFSRAGPLDPAFLVTFLLFMIADAGRRGYRHLLDAFWDEARSFGLKTPTAEPVSAPAITKAREKLAPAFIRSLLHQVADTFDAEFGVDLRWLGRRVFAVDGSRMNLQRSRSLTHAYGVQQGLHCPQILVSTLFDVVAKVPHDIVVAPGGSCERQELLRMLDRLKPGDVLVLDRGYPSFEIVSTLLAAGIDFVVRVPVRGHFGGVEDFFNSGVKDGRVTLTTPRSGHLRKQPPIEVRAVRGTPPPNGDPAIFLTSLPCSPFPHAQIVDLYKMRWEIEEFYKLEKSEHLGQGQFHARFASGVEQEVNTLGLFVGISRFLMATAAKERHVPYEKLSPKAATLGLATYVLRLVLSAEAETAAPFLDRLLTRIVRTIDPKRPGRLCRRRSFRPVAKWGPAGRRGS